MFDPALEMKDGRAVMPDGPGWGVRIKPEWLAEKLCRQARGFGQEALIEAYQVLAEADLKVKSSEEPEGLTLERAVVALCRKR